MVHIVDICVNCNKCIGRQGRTGNFISSHLSESWHSLLLQLCWHLLQSHFFLLHCQQFLQSQWVAQYTCLCQLAFRQSPWEEGPGDKLYPDSDSKRGQEPMKGPRHFLVFYIFWSHLDFLPTWNAGGITTGTRLLLLLLQVICCQASVMHTWRSLAVSNLGGNWLIRLWSHLLRSSV